MRKLNKKGFTLVELLAVIVILGVLMIVAIPAMSRYIANSKKDVFVNNAKRYISAARYSLLSDGYKCKNSSTATTTIECGIASIPTPAPSSGLSTTKIVIPVDKISIENNTGKSPWGNSFGTNAYVVVYKDDTGNFIYKFIGCDGGSNGITTETAETDLKRSDVKTAVASGCPNNNAYTASATVLVVTAEN